jgi:hypothetical protein
MNDCLRKIGYLVMSDTVGAPVEYLHGYIMGLYLTSEPEEREFIDCLKEALTELNFRSI